jgi:hypothetical protein
VVLGALTHIEAHLSTTLAQAGRRVVGRRPYRVLKARARVPRSRRLRQSMITSLTEAH